MQFSGPSPRLALLAAALLSACAAGGAPGDRGPRSASGIPVTGAFGAYLVGRFAAAETDTEAAADAMLLALKADPDQPEVLNRAFLAALLDGRPEAQRLARRLPDNPAANLLLAGTDVQAGRWDKAEQRVRAWAVAARCRCCSRRCSPGCNSAAASPTRPWRRSARWPSRTGCAP